MQKDIAVSSSKQVGVVVVNETCVKSSDSGVHIRVRVHYPQVRVQVRVHQNTTSPFKCTKRADDWLQLQQIKNIHLYSPQL